LDKEVEYYIPSDKDLIGGGTEGYGLNKM